MDTYKEIVNDLSIQPSESLGQKIYKFRKRVGLSQFDLELEIDAASGSISRVENDLVNPTKETLRKIAKALDLAKFEEASLFEIEINPAIKQDEGSYYRIFPNKIQAQQWSQGNIHNLYLDLSKQREGLDIYSLLGLAYISLEIGNASQTREILEAVTRSLENSDKDDKMLSLYIDCIKSELHVLNDEYKSANDKLFNIINNADNIKDNYLLGRAYFLLGLVNSQNKDSKSGLVNMGKSLEYLDVIRYPTEMGKTYLFITDFLEYEKKYGEAEDYYIKAETIFDKSGNNYLLGWCTGGKAFNSYVRGNTKSAISLAKRAIKIDEHSGSSKQQCYSTSILAKALLVNGDSDGAFNWFERSLNLERNFKKNLVVASNNLYMLFIKSKDSHDSLLSLENIVKTQSPKDKTKEYLVHVAKFLHGQDSKERLEGENGLLYLKEKAGYSHLAKAVESTLVQKRLQPVTT